MSASKTIRDQLVAKIGQRTMYSKMDNVRRIASHSITSDTALYVVASLENIPVATILTREKKTEGLKGFQEAVKNFNFSHKNQGVLRQPVRETTQGQEDAHTCDYQSPIIKKITTIGQKHGIDNIDQNWIDALAILNFIETATTKVLMDHDYTEEEVKQMKWDEKLTKLQNKIYEEAKVAKFTVRTTVAAFFQSYRGVRNDQDHVAHLATSRVTNDDLGLLQKNLNIFIKTVFVEHKKYCLKHNDAAATTITFSGPDKVMDSASPVTS